MCHPRCGLWCVGCPQSGAPRWFLGPASRLRRAQRARAVPAQGYPKRQMYHPRCSLWCVGRPQSGAPCWFLGPALHARGLFRVRARAGLLFPGAQTGPLFPQARARFVFVPWPGDAVFLYSIKRPQACKAAPPITDCTAFLVYINFMTPVPSLVVCGKGLSFRSGFPHFQPSFPQLPTEFFTACPPSTFKNYVNLQQYNAYKREERGKALFFVNSF